ncbi:MAG: glycosyltransferase family 2 protein [Betaproteobacteria bacterium]|nr:glycosyltransferase family 2 protein [Betaproteobacteria bacterium]
MSRQPYSLVIVTLNAAPLLRDCIASAPDADEALVVDCGSTDGTQALAQALGARVLHQDWLGYGPQKRFAALQARHDWVLSLDADERLTPELRASIESALLPSPPGGGAGVEGATAQSPPPAAYALPRRNRFMGRWLRHGEGYPDWCVRLFDRTRANWSADPVHEKLETAGPVARLTGDLLHESEQGLADYLAKQNRYTDLQAARMYAAGQRFSMLKMLLSPLARFVKFYLLRRGFLDGAPGLVHIALGCLTSFLKYAKLRELQARRPSNRS